MIKKYQKNLLSATLLLGLLVLGVCSTMTPGAKALPNSTSITNTQSSVKNNSTLANVNLFPNSEGSVEQYPANATFSPPSANVPLTQSPIMTPLIRPGDTVVYSPMVTPHQWWSIDFWSTTSGGQKPSYMSGQFLAVQNTISGMNTGEWVAYEPMNVGYGTSSSNFVWYQFVVYMYANTLNPSWAVWQFPNGVGTQGTYDWISLSYIVGHTYNFAYTTSGTNTVTFTISDTNDPTHPYTRTYTAPGLQMMYNQNAYSPASCVEGYTSASQLTNVPYFQTAIGSGETTHYHSDSSGIPLGIVTGIWSIWSDGSNHYYWAMLGQYSISSITSTTPYGYGSITNANNLIGTQNGQYTDIWGGNPNDGGNIIGQMNAAAGGNIYIYGYSTSGYYSDLYVYVSKDNVNWIQIGNKVTITQSTPYWISIGPCIGDFSYIAVAGLDTGNSVNLHLDAVKVGI